MSSLRRALDEVHARAKERMGVDDVRRVHRLHLFSLACEVVGRVLIHVSLEPLSFCAGVFVLWVHKQLQATEIGHPVLHGSYDRLEGAEAFRSWSWNWRVPIDERVWHRGHNLRHHPYTNVASRDPDVTFGPTRLNGCKGHRWYHYLQVPVTLFVMWPAFGFWMNLHFAGVLDLFRREDRDFLPDRSWRSARNALGSAMRKFAPYYAKELVLFPALAGPLWWKVVLGNALSEIMRDLYSAASIFCGHIGPGLDGYAPGARAHDRDSWYAMQLEQTQNFDVPYVLSILCGGLDRQIEHHLFPQLPPERLREIAPEVRRICEAHGVAYRSGSWPAVLGRTFSTLWRLSFPEVAAVSVPAGTSSRPQ